jgi:hypothetical protein
VGLRRNVTTRFACGGSSNSANGSASSKCRSASAERTIVRKLWPSPDCIALSARRSSTAGDAGRASKATFPLDSSVRTSVKPAASKQAFSAGMLAFIGLTPRRKAT